MIKIEELMKMLPHRYPFLLIDRVIHLDPAPPGSWVGRKCVSIKNVTMNENFFTGHFPHMPIMPGVLMIEAMAQTCAVAAFRPVKPGDLLEVMILGIDNARFRRPVVPGDQLKITVVCTKDKGSVFSFHAEAHVEDQLAVEADLLAKSFPKKG